MNLSNEQPESDVSNSGYFSKEYFRILYAFCQSAELALLVFGVFLDLRAINLGSDLPRMKFSRLL